MKADDIIEMFAKGSAPAEGLPGTLPAASPAEAVAAAVAASGGSLRLSKAKRVARGASGITRMGVKRWEKILSQGAEAGLFSVAEGYLKLPEAKVETPAAPPEPPSEPVAAEVGAAPVNWTPPAVLECGHTNYAAPDPQDPAHVEAREHGFCCAEARLASARQKAALSVDWRVRGLSSSVPEKFRRSRDRHNGPGFPGLCCDPKTGFYIGGVGNDCRYAKGKKRCTVHAAKE